MKYKTVSKISEAKSIVKKSQFVGYIYPLKFETEIKDIIKKLKVKGVGHVAFAFEVNGVSNYSDDGEPSKTAGMPLFNIIKYNKLQNVLICVTRVFGGILLGTGGLISAYGDAGRQALAENEIIEKDITKEVVKEIPINEFSKLEKELKMKKIDYSVDFKLDRVIVKMNVLVEDNI